MKPRHHHPPSSPPVPNSAAAVPAEESQGNTPNSGVPEHIPQEWVWHFRTLNHLRDRLTKAHAPHAHSTPLPAEMLGTDLADSPQDQHERDLLWAELAGEEERLFEVDCALQRIHDGVYGFCEETGLVIPPERLRAMPWTRYCRSAAAKREQRGRLRPKPER